VTEWRVLFRNRDGEPIDIDTFALLLERDDYRRVEHDTIDGVEVSTVWLGVVHPGERIFETMVFGGALHGEQWRWSTEAEALMGHASVCHLVRENPMPPPRQPRPTYDWQWIARKRNGN